MAELLVSVRSPQEARAALAGGATLIDIKEPTRGSLGPADDAVISAIVRVVGGRRPVSAAMGELVESGLGFGGIGLSYLKWGLAGCGGRADWPGEWAKRMARISAANETCQVIATAYADWKRAQSPAPEEVLAFVCGDGCAGLLLDTWCKDGTTLLDWLAPMEIESICRTCRRAGVRIALAGSLGGPQISRLSACRPDWFAVRGAACSGGRREAAIDADSVRLLVVLINKPFLPGFHPVDSRGKRNGLEED
jgi:(5-formylfuran-3-yl)methyl phosphate synthase